MWIFAAIISVVVIGLVLLYVSHTKKSSNKKIDTNKVKQTTSVKNVNEKINDEQVKKANRKGELGEYKINLQLGELSKQFKYIDDIVIRTDKGLTQIDHVLITPVGLFVIETKNYTGKIYGKPKYKNWIQYINGSKESFYNPIRQNAGHIQALKKLLKLFKNIEYHSIISFTRRCELRIDLELRTPQSEIMVVYDTNLTELIMKKYRLLEASKDNNFLNTDEITEIYDYLVASNITNQRIRQEHIDEINSKLHHSS
jgi:hypothetical protein